jgi:sialidase-1
MAERHRRIQPKHRQTVCAWSAAHPRHDHQLVFPLSGDRLLLVWSEYYVRDPALVERSPTDREGGAGDSAPCRLSGKISRDAGRTWSETFTVQENLWGRNVKHPNLIRGENGDLVLTFTAWLSDTQRHIFMKRSPDEGATWSEPERIAPPGFYCTNNDHILRLSSGRVLLPAHGGPGFVPGEGPLHAFCLISEDDCRTWRLSEDTMTAPGRGAHEPSIVQLRDGRLLCFLRTTQRCVYRAMSEDGGERWTEPEPTDLAAPDSPPLLTRMPDGDLLLLWNNVASDTNWPRTPLTAAVSSDEGGSWRIVGDIDNREDRDAAYASVHFNGAEALVAYYTRPTDWARDCEIALCIYDIDAFEPQQGGIAR